MDNLWIKKIKLSDSDIDLLNFNNKIWENNAEKHKTSNFVSWGDLNLMDMEFDNILNYINDWDTVLDAWCSNWFTTFKIWKAKNITLKAFDYSEKSIEQALIEQKINGNNNIKFYHWNILDIEESDETFDKVYSIRVVINLLTWELQQKAILEMHRVLKKWGLYLFSEAFYWSLWNINKLRELWWLKPLTVHDFNLYFYEEKLEKFISEYFEIVDIKKFSSIYYVWSRFLRYLTMDNFDNDSFDNDFNNFIKKYSETENSWDFWIQKLYILRKKIIWKQE